MLQEPEEHSVFCQRDICDGCVLDVVYPHLRFSCLRDWIVVFFQWNSVYLQWKCFCFQSQTAHCGHMEVCGFQKNKPLFMDAEAASVGQFGGIFSSEVESSPFDTGGMG